MRKILIHRCKEENIIRRAYIIDDKISSSEIVEHISKYNASNQFESASWGYIPDDILDVVQFLINDRKIDINRHIEELADLERSVDFLRDDICQAIDDLKNRIEKKDK